MALANPPTGPSLPQSSTRMTEEVAHLIIRSSTPVRAFDNVGEVATVAVFPDRRRMATSSSDGILRVWDINNGVLLKELEGSSETMGRMTLSRDGQLIASPSELTQRAARWTCLQTGQRSPLVHWTARPSCGAQ
ncbi:hypothetical protein M405DRAFT_817018 [Rhizopogon salebrosus TDB-379]|nr:hypothetical protein M405DRAFT_817018 [Rhizopogon salebrosus TDB-379]